MPFLFTDKEFNTMLMKRLQILPQYLAPQRALTRLAGWLSVRTCVWFKNWQISFLIRRYGVNINEAVSSNLADYPTFNSFFTRRLKPELRPINPAPDAIVSPADGAISQAGTIKRDLLFQAKGFDFSLEQLLGGQTSVAESFYDGTFATIYLSPKDYHRVHMPISGTLRETVFIPGKLFSVNTKTAQAVPQLFARNERLVSIFDTELGPVAIILVGAMLVGSIKTVWGADTQSGHILHKQYPDTGNVLEKGVEMGHFEMGSTAILLFPARTNTWLPHMQAGTIVKMGEQLGTIMRN